MKKLKQNELEALKQYVAKELQMKKFLSDAFDMVEVCEKLIAEQSSHEATLNNIVAEIQNKTAVLDNILKKIENSTEDLKAVNEKANEIVEKANKKAEEIEIAAENKSNAMINHAEEEVKAAREFASVTTQNLEGVKFELSALTKEKNELEAEIAQLKAKFM